MHPSRSTSAVASSSSCPASRIQRVMGLESSQSSIAAFENSLVKLYSSGTSDEYPSRPDSIRLYVRVVEATSACDPRDNRYIAADDPVHPQACPSSRPENLMTSQSWTVSPTASQPTDPKLWENTRSHPTRLTRNPAAGSSLLQKRLTRHC